MHMLEDVAPYIFKQYPYVHPWSIITQNHLMDKSAKIESEHCGIKGLVGTDFYHHFLSLSV